MKTGGVINNLEQEYAKFCGKKYAVAVSSGTSALHLALIVMGIGKGDEVIVPDFTMVACGYAVAYTGAKVITVDCKDDLNIDENLIEEKITKRTKAIMPVHIYGRLCNMKAINKIAKKHGLKVIEDACEAQGAKTGNADITCYSLYKNKIISGEEGGIITTNNKDIYDKLQDLKCMAFGKKHNYYHTEIGYNYRITESSARMALESLRNVKENLKKRKAIADDFDKQIPPEWQMPKRDVVWVYDLLPPKGIVFEGDIREFFKPLSTMPMFKQKVGQKAKYYGDKGIYINVRV
jgi:dTDP-4-amino-4,6-dideoxygalactose transaminase